MTSNTRNIWRQQAECEGADPSIFFAERGANTRAPALAYCNKCSVQDSCLAEAVVIPDLTGIWGGKTFKERRRIRQSLKLSNEMPFDEIVIALRSQRQRSNSDA